MSVINQLLIDLDRRRASGDERGGLPGHVRALPQVKDPARAWRIGGALGLAAAVLGTLAVVADVKPVARFFARTADPAVTNAAATPARSRGPADDAERVWTWASRMSLELASAPQNAADVVAAQDPQRIPAAVAPVATASVVNAPQRAAEPVAARPEPRPESDAVPRAAAPRPVAAKPEAVPQDSGEIDKQARTPTAREQAEADYARGTLFLQQGRFNEAREVFEAALRRYPQHHGARQALLGVLIDSKQHAEAERLLQEGLRLSPGQTGFAMALARLQVERGDSNAGVDTLMRGLDHARSSPDYVGFLAALLQRQQRHAEAVEQFQAALRLRPQNGVWLLGMGVSLQALGRVAEAQEAFQRARSTGTLSAELQAFADQRLRQIQ